MLHCQISPVSIPLKLASWNFFRSRPVNLLLMHYIWNSIKAFWSILKACFDIYEQHNPTERLLVAKGRLPSPSSGIFPSLFLPFFCLPLLHFCSTESQRQGHMQWQVFPGPRKTILQSNLQNWLQNHIFKKIFKMFWLLFQKWNDEYSPSPTPFPSKLLCFHWLN